MRGRLIALPVTTIAMLGLVTGSVLGAGTAADAATKAKTTVTIQADQTDLSGTVKSKKPHKCADGRTVILKKQVGSRGGGDDQRIATDTAELQGSSYVWSTGNTGIEGKFYAKVKKTAHCKGDTSKTIRAVRSN